ncbi:baseplate [Salmonella enterica]|nr:baseplate [Salmonella enterica]EKT2376718.1 baseplate [Salmonella enterica]EKT2381409.1 baseplate [Salmonella enterica]EKT2502773.1 baseplate [Salmonella enterica]EKT2726668.1 baseplate [Salmonella enterica]
MATLTNQEWLLAIFRKKQLKPTGKQEFVPVECIDTAFAAALNDAFEPLVISATNRMNKSFSAFLKRSPRDRITVGSFNDIKEWFAAVEASRAGRKDSPHLPVNKLAMPLVNLSRSPAFSIYEGELSRDVFNDGEITDENNVTSALVSTIPFSLNYSLWIASDEKESLGMVASAFAFWLRLYASHGQASFTATSVISDVEMPINCVIEGQKSIAFQPFTSGTEEDRIFAVGLDMTVVADLPLLTYVEQVDAKITVKAKVQDGPQ